MIQKLLLVRVNAMRSDLLDKSGLKAFAGDPLSVSPKAWHDEHGLSHYGFELKGMSLKDFKALEAFADVTEGVTVHEHDGTLADSLASVGLRINESAKE